MRREQKRQDYENRNLGNYSRLFPKNEKTEMDYYLNILNTAFNLFYPVGKHLQWRKTYEKIKVNKSNNSKILYFINKTKQKKNQLTINLIMI